MARIARVAIDSPLPQLDRVFEYEVPPADRERIAPGMRVKAPLRAGGRIVTGWVLGTADEPEYSGRLAQLDRIVGEARVLDPEIAALARVVADRQAGTLADVLRLAVPARSARLEERWFADETGDRARRADRPEPFDAPEAPDFTGARAALRVPVGVVDDEPRHLGALADLVAVTVAGGRSAILLVPDHRDLELAHRALAARLPASRLRRFDSQLKPMPRYDEFLRALEPVPQAIVGTRSAVWAPAHDLGLILMWDDGDESYREPLAPYPHTRETALVRAERSGCGLVLAAHSPSLEARRLVRSGWLVEASAPGAGRPRVVPAAATIGDEPLARAGRIPQAAWRAARAAIRKGPVLVQVGRAGYRPGLACDRCRALARCGRCGGPLGQAADHRPPGCTVCGAIHVEWRCPECDGERLRASAVGHERTAEELGRAFPDVPVVVADGERRLVEVDASPKLVVATRGAEPVAADGYRAVLLLDAEGLLARESLDAVGDALRAWSNAAALAADDAPVVITGAPSAPLHALRDWQQPAAADAELDERRALEFPPAVRVATARGTEQEVDGLLRRVADLGLEGLHVLGPVPDPDDANRFRATLRFPYRAGPALAAACKAELVERAAGSRRRVANRPAARASTLRVRFDDPEVF